LLDKESFELNAIIDASICLEHQKRRGGSSLIKTLFFKFSLKVQLFLLAIQGITPFREYFHSIAGTKKTYAFSVHGDTVF
jgi:hypothetical protein